MEMKTMKNWFLVSFSFLDTGIWFHKLVLTDNEEKISPHFSGNEEIRFRPLKENEIVVLKKARLPIVDLVTR